MNRTPSLILFAVLMPLAYADQGSFTNSGGSSAGGGGVYVSSSVTNPPGALSLSCVGTTAGACAGGSLTYSSTDGTTSISAVFTSGSYAESCAGGGKGGHVTCGYSLTASFSGTLTVNGAAQAITGVTSQAFSTSGGNGSGRTAYNSAYAPFYYSDSGQILRSDDLLGTNQISYGTQGSDVGQFYGAYGIALDSAGRIYVADTYNCRIVRIDDMTGANWTSYGTCGSGQDQFYDPSGIAVDSAGRIYVMDTGNCRVVRVDNLSGANWIAYGSQGSGAGQFAQWLTSVAVDAGGHVYVADTGNKRIVRIDDMTGTNWTALTQSVPVNGATYSFNSPVAVALDAAGKIYVGDNTSYQPEVVRVDDMTGANWTYLFTGANTGINTMAIDQSGAVFLGGSGARIVVDMAAVLNSTNTLSPYGPYYVFGITPVPLPSPRPSAISFTPATLDFSQNVGTAGSQTMTVSNFGGSPLSIAGITASGAFSQSNNCSGQLTPGASCTVTVTYSPTATGPATGQLTVVDNAGNLSNPQTIVLTGQGTAPVATVTPASLTFSSQVLGTSSNARTVTLQNTGTGPMTSVSVAAATATPFSQTNTCSAGLVAGASCTISVTFTPTALGTATGALTITDDAGVQTVSLSGNGSNPVSLSTTSVSFGSVVVGATSTAHSVTVTNRGPTALTFTNIATTAGYAVASNTCGAGINAGASCTVGVTFTPTALGTVNGTLTFTDSAPTSPQSVTLSGSGTAPVTLSTTSLSYNTTVLGSTASAKTVTLTNHLTGALNFSAIAATGPFAIASNTCGASIAGGASCTVGVTFTPTAVGNATGVLTFTDDAGTQTLNLAGAGSAPVTFSATSLSLGTVTVGQTSSARSVTLTNRTAGTLTFTSIATAAPFAISSNTCGTSIAAGGTCTVAVTFKPSATGTVSGTLTFTDSAIGSPQTVSLSGTGK